MSFRSSGPARPPAGRTALKLPRWPRYLLPALAGLIALIVVVVIIAGVWTDFLWFRSVHYGTVFGVTYGTRWALFFVAGIFMAFVTGLNAVVAFRLRPAYRPVASQRPGVETYRLAVDPHRRLLLGIALGLVGLISGIAAAGAWRTWLLFVNQVPFHQQDPQFHLDISFFVFTYPFIRLVLSYLFAAVWLSLAAAVLVHALYGGLRLQGRRVRATSGAQMQLFILVGAFVLLKGVAYWFDRYGIDFSQRGTVTTGASYTDVNAVLPAKTVLAVIAVICALLFFAGAVRHSAMLPAVGFGLLVLSAIIIGGVYPAVIQQFVVKPNELAKESKYIHREIVSTRNAYAVSGVRVIPYPGAPKVPPSQLADQVAGLNGLRLMDPAVVSQTFQQLQQVKGFYQFPDQLSVDRYRLAGGGQIPQDMVVAVRGMGGPPQGQGNWINTHLVYTHGFGFVAAKADASASGGLPQFVESDIPPHGQLGPFQPRVYFGPMEDTYAIVGGPPGRPGQELDYPYENASGQKNYTYNGSGGVPVGSPMNRFLYAVKFRELNILLSGAINNQSKILYDRQPLARVAKVAPFLTLDGSPYPVVADGRILWVVDGYTTTDLYPYSERISMPQATSTSQAPNGSIAGQMAGNVNYIRNSVKAVVDAYSGAVTLYQWGSPDPLLRTWMNAFPGVVKPSRDIPAYLRPHLRYPPVRGPAADPGQVPRPEPAVLLRRAELLDRAGRSHRRRRRREPEPAALLPDDEHARLPPARVLAHHHAGAEGAAEPGRLHGRQQQPAGRLRHDKDPPAAAGRRHPGPPAGAEQLRVQHDRVQGAFAVPPGRLERDQGGPDRPAGQRRPAVRGAHLHPGRRGNQRGFLPDPETGVRVLRRPGRVRHLAAGCAGAGVHRPAERRPGRAQRHGRGSQRARPQVPAAGRAGLRHRAGRPAQRQPERLCPGHRPDEAGARQRPAGRREGIGRRLREQPVPRSHPHP